MAHVYVCPYVLPLDSLYHILDCMVLSSYVFRDMLSYDSDPGTAGVLHSWYFHRFHHRFAWWCFGRFENVLRKLGGHCLFFV